MNARGYDITAMVDCAMEATANIHPPITRSICHTIIMTALNTHALQAAAPSDGWMPIETAPKDGTIIDVWAGELGRQTVFWGLPVHCCGEMGSLCDSDWHSLSPDWVDDTFNEQMGVKPTHWRPLPAAPSGGQL